MFRINDRLLLASLFLFVSLDTAAAQSVQKPEKDITPESEMATFEMGEGFEVNLFADESDSVANPIAIRFDPRGRLWVLCTWAYPQLEPDDVPDEPYYTCELAYPDFAPNLWPAGPPDLREAMMRYYGGA